MDKILDKMTTLPDPDVPEVLFKIMEIFASKGEIPLKLQKELGKIKQILLFLVFYDFFLYILFKFLDFLSIFSKKLFKFFDYFIIFLIFLKNFHRKISFNHKNSQKTKISITFKGKNKKP